MRRLSNASKTSTSSISSNGFVALDTILKTESSPMDSLNSNQSKEESKTDCLTAESLQEIRKRLKKLSVDESSPSPKFNEEFTLTEDENTNLSNQKLSLEQNCKSLELRKNKERDISAEDWLNRRKSYGFEKMYQPNESSSLGGIESSTDSGLGRSSDLPSNWSPTIDSPQRTIITFGDKTKPAATTSISLFSNPSQHHHHHVKATESGISDKPIPMRRKASLERKEEIKRHSIAIDEKVDEHYQHRNSSDRKISLVNLNGPYNDKLTSTALVNDGRHKKVEFCKTEIHFAAESGRVNIVETDGKPPPTNNFRRRRRNSGALLDQEYSIQQESMTIDDDEVDKPTIESHFDSVHKTNVTTTVGSVYSSAREDDTDEGQSDTDCLRGILKNKPIKPKPYHLGENLESGSSLWGVRLRPVENQHTAWRHSAELESVLTGKKSTEDALEIEFKNLVKAMDQEKSSNNTNSQPHYQSSTVSSNGYSTKINLSSLPTIQQQHPANKAPLTSLYENPTLSSSSSAATIKPVTIEAAPRTSLVQIGSIHEKVNNNSNIYSNVNTIQQDNSVKVNIQNFESLSPALSRSNSLRIKRDNVSTSNNIGTKDDSSALKLSTGTRQLKAHELTYFGIKGTPITRKTSDTNITNKSQFTQLSTSSAANVLSSSNKINISNNSINLSDKRNGVTNKVSTTSTSSSSSTKVTINHQKPDLLMHHHQKIEKSSTPELTTSEKKSMLEALDSCIDETKNLEPIYENLYQNNKYERKLDLARDKKILDELARAADEIMNTCKEMYHADSEEKKRKSSLVTSNGTCLETIKEGTEGRQLQQQHQQQQHSCSDIEQPKVMKSKGVQVSRNFEDSLRRYHRMQQRTSSQSSIESLPRNSKISTTTSPSSVTARTRRTTKSGESTASTTISSTKSSSSCRKRENGNGSDGSRRIQRVSSRERMHKSNASSSESDHPNSTVEVPRRPRRTKVVKSHREEAVKDEKKSSRVTEASSSSRRSTKPEHNSTSKETKVRSSVLNKSSSSANPNSSILSTTAGGITTYVSISEHATETMMIPPRRKNYHRKKVIRRNSSLKSKNAPKRITRQTRRTQLESCICS